ncbi:hypothetical protein [Anoxybacillus gonensis]|uniref:hypothetical protein n=1 Tax=Anoxybacillus gonensis TaxID=198467 RepID=UPI0002BDA018|nr:hypothetical protein [Anoxybacillus gonensis]EMI09557.1 hypothetical protein F510_2464 [Anoxybacillus gonensis]
MKKPLLSFFIACILILMNTYASTTFAAPSVKTLWQLSFDSGFTFATLPKNDAVVHIRSKNVSHGVYHFDIMTIDQKGKIKNKWNVTEQDFILKKVKSEHYLIAVNYTKGIVTAYSLTGKKLWKYDARKRIDSIDQLNEWTYVFTAEKIIALSSSGKVVTTFKNVDGVKYFANDGSLYVLRQNDTTKYELQKYSNSGKLQWKTNVPIPTTEHPEQWNVEVNVEVKHISNTHVYIAVDYFKVKKDEFRTREDEMLQIDTLYAINTNGKISWSADITAYNVVEKNDRVIVEGHQFVYSIDQKGKPNKIFSQGIHDVYLTENGDFFFLDYDKRTLALVSSQGKYKWKISFPKKDSYFLYGQHTIFFKTYDSKELYLYEHGKQIGVYKSNDYFYLTGLDEQKRIIYIEEQNEKGSYLRALKY